MCCCCSEGYPEKYNKNILIENLNNIKLANNEFYFMLEQKKKMKKYMQLGKSIKLCFYF